MSPRFEPGGALRGTLTPPPDKSISHRAAIVAAMAEGETEVQRLPGFGRHAVDARGGTGR